MKTCYNCGKDMKETDGFCARCGWKDEKEEATPAKSIMPIIPFKKIAIGIGGIIIVALLIILIIYAVKTTPEIKPVKNITNTTETKCNAPYISFEKGCCIDINDNKICDNAEIKNETAEQNITQPEPEPLIELDPRIIAFQKKAKQHLIDGYSFMMGDDTYLVKYNKTKIKLAQWTTLYFDEGEKVQAKVDVVYIDRAAKTAVGYCEINVKKDYGCAKISKTTYNLSYEKYATKLPTDYILEIKDAKVVNDKTQIQGSKEVTEIRTETQKIWIDRYLGFPLRIETANEGMPAEEHDFEKFVRGVQDSEITR